MDYINSKCINFYNDQEEDLFVNDLSDMGKTFADFEKKLKSNDLKYERINGEENIYKLVIANELDRYIDAIAFFQIDDALALIGLVVYTRNDASSKEDEFVYSVGYCVKETYRGKGIARNLVAESIPQMKAFLESAGPNFDIGPDDSFRYTLESVVGKKNGPSNRLAQKLLHSGGDVVVGSEYRTRETSNVYRVSL